jgi:RimJ/RimL family protein N-acetyltransferase
MKLTPIGRNGEAAAEVAIDDFLRRVVEKCVRHFGQVGFVEPWIAYIALGNSGPVGTCAFKTAPLEGRVEIAYGTLPGQEGKGIATAMAKELVRIAREQDEGLTIFAQTLPEENASTSVLKKLGFRRIGPVEHPEDGTVWEWELAPRNPGVA